MCIITRKDVCGHEHASACHCNSDSKCVNAFKCHLVEEETGKANLCTVFLFLDRRQVAVYRPFRNLGCAVTSRSAVSHEIGENRLLGGSLGPKKSLGVADAFMASTFATSVEEGPERPVPEATDIS